VCSVAAVRAQNRLELHARRVRALLEVDEVDDADNAAHEAAGPFGDDTEPDRV